jgi:hypothetical protein
LSKSVLPLPTKAANRNSIERRGVDRCVVISGAEMIEDYGINVVADGLIGEAVRSYTRSDRRTYRPQNHHQYRQGWNNLRLQVHARSSILTRGVP